MVDSLKRCPRMCLQADNIRGGVSFPARSLVKQGDATNALALSGLPACFHHNKAARPSPNLLALLLPIPGTTRVFKTPLRCLEKNAYSIHLPCDTRNTGGHSLGSDGLHSRSNQLPSVLPRSQPVRSPRRALPENYRLRRLLQCRRSCGDNLLQPHHIDRPPHHRGCNQRASR